MIRFFILACALSTNAASASPVVHTQDTANQTAAQRGYIEAYLEDFPHNRHRLWSISLSRCTISIGAINTARGPVLKTSLRYDLRALDFDADTVTEPAQHEWSWTPLLDTELTTLTVPLRPETVAAHEAALALLDRIEVLSPWASDDAEGSFARWAGFRVAEQSKGAAMLKAAPSQLWEMHGVWLWDGDFFIEEQERGNPHYALLKPWPHAAARFPIRAKNVEPFLTELRAYVDEWCQP